MSKIHVPRAYLAALAILFFTAGMAGGLVMMTVDYGPGAMAAVWSENEEGKAQQEEKASVVLVIDAGHGGFDGGAQAADGTQEKEINLAIAQALRERAEAYPVEVIMTRENDTDLSSGAGTISEKKSEDLLKRKEIMKGAEATLAVSIHLNSYPADSGVYGAQVFYPAQDVTGTEEGEKEQGEEQGEKSSSRSYAEAVQQALEAEISDGRERMVMEKNDILLFRMPVCPIILVECGFLSNGAEAERLKTAEYQEQIAQAIWQGVNEILCLPEKEKLPVIDSANRTPIL
jgi:N-acetylmuramoyl-L-alanine amidase